MKRPKDELELLMKKVRKEKKEKKRVKNTKKHEKEIVEKASKLTKSQKWALKKKQKKLKKETQNYDEFQKYKDKVEFGETVHAPPSLVAPRRVEKTKNAARVIHLIIKKIYFLIDIYLFFSLDKNSSC